MWLSSIARFMFAGCGCGVVPFGMNVDAGVGVDANVSVDVNASVDVSADVGACDDCLACQIVSRWLVSTQWHRGRLGFDRWLYFVPTGE